MTLTKKDYEDLASEFGYELAAIKAVEEVESAGSGFFKDWSNQTRIKIQFEPHWFKRYEGTWINNGVRPQREEWDAFNKAYAINAESAMLSTSWGLGQIMGFNFKRLGYPTVGAMVDDFKIGERQQLRGMLRFILSNKKLNAAMKAKDWRTVAYYYNGQQYEKYDYHNKLAKAYAKHS